MKLSLNGIQIKIIHKLFNQGCWLGGKHTSIDNLNKGLPPSLRREINKGIEDLIKRQIIIASPKTKEQHAFLNRNMIRCIYKVEEWYGANLSNLKKGNLLDEFEIDC